MNRKTNEQKDKWTEKHINRKTNGHKDTRTDRQIDVIGCCEN